MKHKIKSIIVKLKRVIYRGIWHYIFPKGFYFVQKGYCPCCDKKVVFKSTNSWLRDYFLCSNCYSVPRERAIMVVVEKYFPDWRNLTIHESSPSGSGASLKLKRNAKNYIETQYYPDKPLGTLISGVQNQDLENQTFNDEAFDIVITQDVLEHVYNPEKAFSEIARTLKKGGAHIFTTPLVNKFNKTEVWAVKGKNNDPIFLKEPEWHRNPVDLKGSPVTMHWGYDITDIIKKSCDLNTTIEYVDVLYLGIRAEFNEVLITKKESNSFDKQ